MQVWRVSDDSSGCLGALAVIGLLVLVSQCHSGKTDPSGYLERDPPEAQSEAALETAVESLEGSTYDDAGAPYGCTDDCSGHDAGYAWAQENGVTDSSECVGDSQSFIEGCEAYVDAVEAARADALDENSDDQVE